MNIDDRQKGMLQYVSEGATDADLEAAGYTPEEISIIPKKEVVPFTPKETDNLEAYTPTVREGLRSNLTKGGEALGLDAGTAEHIASGIAGTRDQMGLLDFAPVAGSVMATQEGYRQAKGGYNSDSSTDMAMGALGMGLGAVEALPLVGAGVKALSNAVPGKVKADIVGTARSFLDGDAAFRTESSLSPVGVGADVPKGSNAIGNAANGKNPFVVPRDNPTENLLDFYSPIKSSIEALNFGEKGLPGNVILKHLREKTPNTNIAELDSYKLELDPNTRYTQEDIKELLPKGDYKVQEVNPSSYYSTQRQKPKEGTSDYFELSLQGDAETPFNHLTDKDLAHARGSFIVGPDKKRLLVEELQSDLLQNVGKSRSTTNPTRSFFSAVGTDFEPLKGLGVDTDKLEGILQKNLDGAVDNETTVKELYNTFEVKPESLRGPPSSHLTRLTAKKLQEFGYLEEDIDEILWSSIDLDFQVAISDATIQNKKAAYTKKDFPVTSTADVTKKLLLGLIAKAQKEGATEIVMPPLYRIAAMRAKDFMEKARGMGQELMDSAVAAAEKALKPTYVDSFDKATEMLNREFSSLDGSPIRVYEDDMRFQGSEFSRKGKEKVKVLDITNFPSLAEYRLRFAEGGMVEDKQMNRLMQEGGMADDGMTHEPVTGNEVPPGSLAKEVRDDISTQLSEGEYVIPADVVRFFGVKYFEDLRSQAKQGLSEMEANGRIGGAVVDSNGVPAEEDDALTPEEEQMLQEALGQTGMAIGGDVTKPWNRKDFKFTPMPTGQQISDSGTESRKYVDPTTGEVKNFEFSSDGTPLGLVPENFVPWTQEIEDNAKAAKAASQASPTPEAPSVRGDSWADRNDPALNGGNPTGGGTGDGSKGTSAAESWAKENAEALSSDPYQFGVDSLTDNSGKLQTAGATGAGFVVGGPMGAMVGAGVSKAYNKIQNIASANAALQVMQSQGLEDSRDYRNLQKQIDSAIDDLPASQQLLVEQELAGTGKKYKTAYDEIIGAKTPTTTGVKTPGVPGTSAGTTPSPVPPKKPAVTAAQLEKTLPTTTVTNRGVTSTQTATTANVDNSGSKNGDLFSSRSTTGSTAPTSSPRPEARPSGGTEATSTAREEAQRVADRMGVSMATRGKAKGGLITKPTKTTAKTKGLGGKQ